MATVGPWIHGSVITAVGIALVAAGCAASGEGDQQASSLSGAWTLIEVNGQSVGAMLDEGGRAPTAEFIGEPQARVSGFAGVNRYSGSFEGDVASRGRFTAGALAATKMAGPPGATRVEVMFLAAMQAADSYVVEGGRLVMRDGDRIVLIFDRAQ